MIKNPTRRTELLEFVRELADPGVQESLWIRHEDAPRSSGIDEVFHLFFDDTDIAEKPFDEIGEIFRDEGEASGLQAVTMMPDAMLVRLRDQRSPSYMNDSAWPELVGCSQKALNMLSAADADLALSNK